MPLCRKPLFCCSNGLRIYSINPDAMNRMRPAGLWIVALWALLSLSNMESVANQQKSLKALLDEKKDHRRVVLLYGRQAAQGHLIDQQQIFRTAQAGMDERDIDVIVTIDYEMAEPDRQYLMAHFHFVPSDDFAGYLIGKDGTMKHKFTTPISTKELFALVDAMPMRRK